MERREKGNGHRQSFCHPQARIIAIKTGREALLLSYIYVLYGSKVTAVLAGYSALPREAHNEEYLQTIRELPKTLNLPQPRIAVSPLFVQLMHKNYHKIVKHLKSFKIIIV